MKPLSSDAFKQEVQAWAGRLGVEPETIQLRPMTRKWGSCSTNGRVTFSIDLLTQPSQERSRVIVHELLHLKIPNHGPLFRRLETAYLSVSNGEPTRLED